MGLMDKVKNLFTEEVEVEENIKVPEKKNNIPIERTRREEIIKEEIVPEKEMVTETPALVEERPKMPIYFDDTAFEDLKKEEEKKEEKPKKTLREKKDYFKKERSEVYKGPKIEVVEDHKLFTPSPIISPVYGVLDTNYTKDDIASKKKEKDIKRKSSSVSVDDIRNKAYGTLEDDLENTFIETKNEEEINNFEELEDTNTELELFEEPKEKKTRSGESIDLIQEDFNKEKEIEESDLSEELEKQKQKIEEINKYIKKNTTKKEKKEEPDLEDMDFVEENEEEGVESELFDLIDSMYEKRDEE